ncbi:ultraviolet-B receptor UVR8-like isoform X2 [Corylus avellana]|uniref:ultraviolet-B receptor UVR8-like isoform X2 n=1 Tax=Corylus avellana TaxID=13451 RepID=UPI00286BB5BF|nr:ultraviolet-B receptor UVR8-like isoform X2 [Corylus avellana]XP_059447461.1 ultraviolet-B receptor UVR8-like isoform X2 [Corylus avellana]
MEHSEKGKEAKHHDEEEDEEEERQEVQEIWSWGAGTEGQLGTGRLEDEHLPQLLHLPSMASAGPISLLSCGGAHVIALTSGGRVLTWGRGTSGQLGHGDMVNSLYPKLVTSLQAYFISHVSAGWSHSGFVSDTGYLFTCGDGSFGQLGHGDYSSHCSPVRVSFFVTKHVEQIACGMRHSLVLLKGSSGFRTYAFGSGKRGQLGISNDKIKSVSLPEVTHGLEDVRIVSITANGDHSAALSVDGHLYTWGRGFSGTPDAHFPQCLLSSFLFTRAALGWNHALALTNPRGAILEKVSGLDALKIVHVAAGAEHSAVVTENEEIKTWGWGEHGQLGLGNTCDQTSPQAVSLSNNPKETATFKVFCGSGFTYAIQNPCV